VSARVGDREVGRKRVTLRGPDGWKRTVQARVFGPLCVHPVPGVSFGEARISHVETGYAIGGPVCDEEIAEVMLHDIFRVVPPESELWSKFGGDTKHAKFAWPPRVVAAAKRVLRKHGAL
jgi:hypothetical protein